MINLVACYGKSHIGLALSRGRGVLGEEQSVLRWGGIAGLLAGIIIILVFVIVFAFAPGSLSRDPQTIADFEEEVIRYPEEAAVRNVANSLFLVAAILAMALFLALYRALRKTSLASALFGSVLGIVGLVMVLSIAVLDTMIFRAISNVFLSAATAQERTSVVVLLPFLRGINLALAIAFAVLMSAGYISLGAAMVGNGDFGRAFGLVSAGLGVVGFGALLSLPVAFTLAAAQLSLILPIPFFLLFGWKVYSLSRAA